ncbi:MAG: eL32 family ribosomal protein [Candidatus Nanoarchaeia archaeon]|nr:eL32 family ribosomal protein [Candidatus Nanoarchaeia archaeon]
MNKVEMIKKVRKYKFLKQDAHKLDKLKKNWRKPKGLDSKMRRNLRSYRRLVRIGYGSPEEIKGLNRQGIQEIKVNNIHDLDKIKPDQLIIISSTLGLRKKIELVKKIQERKLKVANLKDIQEFIKKSEEKIKKKSDERKSKIEKRAKSKEDLKKKAEKKKESKEEKTQEEKLEEEKKKTLEKPKVGKGENL